MARSSITTSRLALRPGARSGTQRARGERAPAETWLFRSRYEVGRQLRRTRSRRAVAAFQRGRRLGQRADNGLLRTRADCPATIAFRIAEQATWRPSARSGGTTRFTEIGRAHV